MKPHRVRMAHDLLLKFDVLNQLEVRRGCLSPHGAQGGVLSRRGSRVPWLLPTRHTRRRGARLIASRAPGAASQTRPRACVCSRGHCALRCCCAEPLTRLRPTVPCAQVFRPVQLTAEEMTYFHTDEYVEFLRHITPDNQARPGLLAFLLVSPTQLADVFRRTCFLPFLRSTSTSGS